MKSKNKVPDRILPIRPKPSPIIEQNDGFGSTPFQRKLLFYLALSCVVVFAILFITIIVLKIKKY